MKTPLKIIIGIVILALALFSAAFFLFPLPGHVTVLMYHFIDTQERAEMEKNVVSLESFKRHMDFLDRFGYRVLSMPEYLAIQKGARAPRGREVLITFDDGNYTFYDKALPVLQKHGFPVTVFTVSQNAIQQIHGSMTAEQIREISKIPGVTIGSHSRTHPVLPELNTEQIREEVVLSKKELEEMTGRPVETFAYPTGAVNEETMNQVRGAGYELAFTTSRDRASGLPKNHYTLTRVKISRTSDFWLAFWGKISGLYGFFKE